MIINIHVFMFSGIEIDSSRCKKITSKIMTSFTLSKVKQTYAGEYSVVVSNEHGIATFSVKVTVIGKYLFSETI